MIVIFIIIVFLILIILVIIIITIIIITIDMSLPDVIDDLVFKASVRVTSGG
jgi:hypothetical protein